jgi:hypothetical protein
MRQRLSHSMNQGGRRITEKEILNRKLFALMQNHISFTDACNILDLNLEERHSLSGYNIDFIRKRDASDIHLERMRNNEFEIHINNPLSPNVIDSIQKVGRIERLFFPTEMLPPKKGLSLDIKYPNYELKLNPQKSLL